MGRYVFIESSDLFTRDLIEIKQTKIVIEDDDIKGSSKTHLQRFGNNLYATTSK